MSLSKSLKRIKKELEEIKSEPPTNCSAGPISEDNLFNWRQYRSNKIPYAGGFFKLSITFSDKYPFKPPKIKFITRIFHPNINSRGSICLDILNTNWSPALTITKVLLSISSLLTDPNPNDPLSKEAADLYLKSKEQYNLRAREYTLRFAN